MKILEVVIFLFFTQVIFAQGYPVTMESPIMQDANGFEVHTFGDYSKNDVFRYYGQTLKLGYSAGYKVQLGLFLPYEKLDKIGWQKQKVAGFGDFSIFGKFKVYQKDAEYKAVRLLIFAKETFPTGRISTGNNQTTFGLIYGNMQRKLGVHANINYLFSRYSNYLNINFALGSPLWVSQDKAQKINLYFEINEQAGTSNGLLLIDFSPSLQFDSHRKWLFDISYHLPTLGRPVIYRPKMGLTVGARYLGSFEK